MRPHFGSEVRLARTIRRIVQTVAKLPILDSVIAVLQPKALIGIVRSTVITAKEKSPTSAKATPGLASEARRSRPLPVVRNPSSAIPVPTATTPPTFAAVSCSPRKRVAIKAESAPYAEIVGETTLSGPSLKAVKTAMYETPAPTPITSVAATIIGSRSWVSSPRAIATPPAKTSEVLTAITTTRSEPMRRPT